MPAYPSVGTMPTSFVFHVGPYTYKVVFVLGLCDEDGNRLLGRCDPDTHTIYLDSDHRGQNLEQTIIHELTHAWDFAVGGCRDDEANADRNGTIMMALMKDLRDQGGIAAMHRERRRFAMSMATVQSDRDGDGRCVPCDEVEPQDAKGAARAGRAACGVCLRLVAEGSVVNQQPRYDREAKWSVIRRTLYCAHCRHLQSWDEGVWLGLPNGQVVRGPFYVRGSEAEEFLRQNPEAAAVAG